MNKGIRYGGPERECAMPDAGGMHFKVFADASFGRESDPYIVFFESDSLWERMDFPDDTVVFRKGAASDVCVRITTDMLPGDDDLM